MTYKVTAPLVVIANDDGEGGDWYGYVDALVPEGLNDERCKVLVEEGMLEKVKAPKADAGSDGSEKSDKVDDILAEVGEDKEKAAAALEAEKAGKNRTTLVSKLEALVSA